MNKNYVVIFIISVLLFFFTPVFPTFAMTQAEKDSLARQIMQQIAALQTQLNQMIAQQQGGQSSNWCYNFNVNLKIGDSGSDASALNNALSKEGLIVDVIYPANNYFSEKTKLAVIAFQNKYASEILAPAKLTNGTGFIGSSTRKKLNALYGCFRPSISIVYPNGGEAVQIGNTVRVAWNSTGLSDADNVSIIAYMSSNPYLNVKTLTKSVKAKQGYYDWNILTNTLPSTTYPLNLRIKVEVVGKNISSSSASDFTVNAINQGSASISIIYPNGGEVMRVGDISRITWSVTGAGFTSSDYISITAYKPSSPYLNVIRIADSVLASKGYYDWSITKYNFPFKDYPVSLRVKIESKSRNISSFSASDFIVNGPLPSPTPLP